MNDIPRLAATERLILELLIEAGKLFGLQLVERSHGRLKRGTVYVTLGRMQDKGLLESSQEPLPPGAIGLPGALYRPTGHGLRVLEAGAWPSACFWARGRRRPDVVGGRLIALARAWFDETTVERVFEPLIADWQRECASNRWTASAALSPARLPRLSQHVPPHVRPRLLAPIAGGPGRRGLAVHRRIRSCWCAPTRRHLARQRWSDGHGRVPASVAVDARPPDRGSARMHRAPQQPLAALPGEARHAAGRHDQRCIAMVVLTGWMRRTPIRDFASRSSPCSLHSEGTVKSPVRRGMRELTLPELWASSAPREPLVAGDYGRSLELHNRLSVMLMPFCMMAVGIAASQRPRDLRRCDAWPGGSCAPASGSWRPASPARVLVRLAWKNRCWPGSRPRPCWSWPQWRTGFRRARPASGRCRGGVRAFPPRSDPPRLDDARGDLSNSTVEAKPVVPRAPTARVLLAAAGRESYFLLGL